MAGRHRLPQAIYGGSQAAGRAPRGGTTHGGGEAARLGVVPRRGRYPDETPPRLPREAADVGAFGVPQHVL